MAITGIHIHHTQSTEGGQTAIPDDPIGPLGARLEMELKDRIHVPPEQTKGESHMVPRGADIPRVEPLKQLPRKCELAPIGRGTCPGGRNNVARSQAKDKYVH